MSDRTVSVLTECVMFGRRLHDGGSARLAGGMLLRDDRWVGTVRCSHARHLEVQGVEGTFAYDGLSAIVTLHVSTYPDDEPAFHIELDATEPSELPAICAAHHVAFELVNAHGTFDWPEFRYTGRRDDLVAFLRDVYDDDGELAQGIVQVPR